jgi:hypothetical protein
MRSQIWFTKVEFRCSGPNWVVASLVAELQWWPDKIIVKLGIMGTLSKMRKSKKMENFDYFFYMKTST